MWNESNISAHFPENMCLHHKICHHKLALIGSLSKVAKEWMGPGYRTNIFPLQVVFSSRNWDVHCLGKVKFVLLVHVLLIHRRFQCTASVFISVAFTLLKKINKNLKLYLKKKTTKKNIQQPQRNKFQLSLFPLTLSSQNPQYVQRHDQIFSVLVSVYWWNSSLRSDTKPD